MVRFRSPWIATICLLYSTATLANFTWIESSSGNLSDSNNWIDNPTLDSSSTLTIATGDDTITWDFALTTIANLTLSIDYSGTVTAETDTDVTASASLLINGGTLLSDAAITANDYTQGSDGTITLELDSLIEGEYGQLRALSTMSLNGTLIINESIAEASGQHFTILDSTNITGQFTSVQLPALSPGLAWSLATLYTDGTLSIVNAPGNLAITPTFWMDAGDEGSVVRDSSNQISQWINKIGERDSFSQSSSSDQPIWIEDAIHQRPVVRFDGNNDRLRTLSSLSYDDFIGLDQHSLLFVMNNTGGENSRIWFDWPNHPQRLGFSIPTPDSSFARFTNGNENTDRILGSTDITDGAYYIIHGLRSGITQNLFIDGLLDASGDASNYTPYGSGARRIGLGSMERFGSDNFGGDFAEIIIYDVALSATEQQSVESYLAEKYGIDRYYTNISVNWDGEAEDLLISTAENWQLNEAPNSESLLVFTSTDNDLTWDSGTYFGIQTDVGFNGSISTGNDINRTLTGTLNLAAGEFISDSLTSMQRYHQTGASRLTLILDRKAMANTAE